MTDVARFLEKKKERWPEFRPNGPKLGPKLGFCHLLKFGSLVFLEIAYSDSFQQCLTCSRGKTHGKKIDQNWAGIRFLVFSQVWFIGLFQQCLTSSRGKTHGKNI